MLPSLNVTQALEQRAALTPDRMLLATEAGNGITARELKTRVGSLAEGLVQAGIGAGDHIVTVLDNSVEYVTVFLAACRIGAVWIPVNPESRGPALGHILSTARPKLLIVEDQLVPLVTQGIELPNDVVLVARANALPLSLDDLFVSSNVAFEYEADTSLDILRCVIFTSGTTGPPKGVMVTERMLMTAAFATGYTSRVEKDDVYLFWEPLYHIGGSQLVVLSLLQEITLVLVPRFSASRFWSQVREFGVTKLHYLGGLLDILLAQPKMPNDNEHTVKLGFGGGARPATWSDFENRFGIPLVEVYGMTEASSFSTLNDAGIVGSIGSALPWFELQLVDTDGAEVAFGAIGELVVSDRGAGLITPGYLSAPKDTYELLRDGKLWTGDLMREGENGFYRFVGRRRDSIRRRGENVSAWEVEHALNEHPDIVDSAVIGVEASIGEQDIHAFIELDNDGVSLPALYEWASSHLGRHQLPRYWSQVNAFERTPSQRILKGQLALLDIEKWDADAE